MRELYDASTAIAAHSALPSVTIEIHHLKIITGRVLQIYQSVTAYTKPAVTKTLDQFSIDSGQAEAAIIYHDKIIACTLIFIKLELHDDV
jgi:hypothetical protein